MLLAKAKRAKRTLKCILEYLLVCCTYVKYVERRGGEKLLEMLADVVDSCLGDDLLGFRNRRIIVVGLEHQLGAAFDRISASVVDLRIERIENYSDLLIKQSLLEAIFK